MISLNSAPSSAAKVRLFRVGVIGASPDAVAVFNRIFTVTQHRARAYEAQIVPASATTPPAGIDIWLLCTVNPHVVQRWTGWRSASIIKTPVVLLAKDNFSAAPFQYYVGVPINPSRLVKVLDEYTIKELNFFPEFEIGADENRISNDTLAGIRLLKESGVAQRYQGLKRALVVDDSLPVRKQVEIEFSLMGVKADLVESGDLALMRIQERSYDIIFLDVVMPGVDGYEVCKRIRRMPAYKAVPIVLLTSRSSSFDKLKGALAGCDTYLVKPINHNEFDKVLAKHFALIDSNGVS